MQCASHVVRLRHRVKTAWCFWGKAAEPPQTGRARGGRRAATDRQGALHEWEMRSC